MNYKSKMAWRIIALLCVCIILYAVSTIFSHYQEYKTAGNEYEQLATIAHSCDIDNNNEAAQAEQAKYISPIDFDALRKINPDIVGWIVVDGTTIDYPIVQGQNNSTYLNTLFTGGYNPSGAIFMDYRNASGFTDFNTIIYGHKMKNNTMFQGLSEYKSQTFCEQYPAFTIYTPEQEYRCEVFSAYVTPAVSEAYILDFENKADYVQYLNTAISRSLLLSGTILSSTDSIVTLSTCDYSYNNARMVVHAKLVGIA